MSKKQEEEQLNRLVDFIKRGKINDVTHMLESDKQKKLQKLTDDRGWSALHFACQHKKYEIALLLIEHKADATLQERFARTPLDCVNDPVVRKELSEAYEAFVEKEKVEVLAAAEAERIREIQRKIQQKREEEEAAEAAVRDAIQRKAEAEAAKRAKEALKINSVEKLLYAMEENDKLISKIRIDSERAAFELQKQLHAANQEINELKSQKEQQFEVEAQLRNEIEALRNELTRNNISSNVTPSVGGSSIHSSVGRPGTGQGRISNDEKSPRPATGSSVASVGSIISKTGGLFGNKAAPIAPKTSSPPAKHGNPVAEAKTAKEAAAIKASQEAAKKPFSFGGIFGRA